jgi:uncharacterized protein YecE (DUF72 family)
MADVINLAANFRILLRRNSRRFFISLCSFFRSLGVIAVILLGTSSFTASGWNGVFCPKGMRSANYLGFYAEQFHTVEVDSTFYGCPTARTINNWGARTPEGFIFSVKVPQVITHEKVLVDCDAELKEFLDTMSILGPKLGPIVFQFPFFNRGIFRDRHEFIDRLVPFLTKLPEGHRFAIEMRNRDWLNAEFADLLRNHGIALVLQDRSFMPLRSPSHRM